MLKALLFDLEGTLVETVYQRSREAMHELRRGTKEKLIGLGVPGETLMGLVRSTLLRNRSYEWVEANLSQSESALFRSELDAFMKPIEMRTARSAKLYPDTVEALEELSARGVEMGLVSNTSREAAICVLGNLGIESFFRVIVTRDDAPRLKPDASMLHVAEAGMGSEAGWLVGDSAFDAEAARCAGLMSVIIRRDGLRPSFRYDRFVESLNVVSSIVFED